ncbi:hypothetical protein V144x_31470 [Gimesia aquarii]|uniref:Uncharacterized protein n=1 Tax=Gimesia aquarii TaxID=2527964 RepID=A0A517VXD5_9PLAN|nr:hypothetical protein V144x_31470 [Gimesia aquarii]
MVVNSGINVQRIRIDGDTRVIAECQEQITDAEYITGVRVSGTGQQIQTICCLILIHHGTEDGTYSGSVIDSGNGHSDGSGVTDRRMGIGGGISEGDLACFSGGKILEGGAGIEGKGAIAIGVGGPFRRRHYDVVSQCAGIVVGIDIRGQDAGGDSQSIFCSGDVGV